MEDVQSFWNDVYTEAIEAGEDVEKTIVCRATGKWNTDPMFIADEVYYYAVQYDNGNIDVLSELECEMARIDYF